MKDEIGYDRFGDRVRMAYSNGTETRYTYDSYTRRLSMMKLMVNGGVIGTRSYHYDDNGNVTSHTGTAPSPFQNSFAYDPLNRLVYAKLRYGRGGIMATDTLTMAYDDMWRITSKSQRMSQTELLFPGTMSTGYDMRYSYGTQTGRHFQLSGVAETHYRTEGSPTDADNILSTHSYSYDPNGNLTYESVARKRYDYSTTPHVAERKMTWDSQNRLRAISDNGYVSLYWYDADGNRTVKEHLGGEAVWVNGTPAGVNTDTLTYTIYPSPYITINGNRWTKHYYIGSERIASQAGTISSFGDLNIPDNHAAGASLGINISYGGKKVMEEDSIVSIYSQLGVPYEVQRTRSGAADSFLYLPISQGGGDASAGETSSERQRSHPNTLGTGDMYFYTRDHLGSTLTVTDSLGATVQRVEYTPWGEVFIEQSSSNADYSTPYLFNGKELDEETGLYYYGARYYDPKTSVWYSTDPMHNMKPSISDYSYCFSNPFLINDPSGMLESTDVVKNKDGTYKVVGAYNDGDNNIYVVNQNGVRTGETIGSSLRPYDFMGTNDRNGTFTNKTETIIDLKKLYVSGKVRSVNAEYSIYHANAKELLDWGMSIFREELKFDSYGTFYSELLVLERLSKNGETLDIKKSMGLDPYTPIRAGTNSEGKPIITTLRAVGNILFGANVRSTKPFLFNNDFYYKPVMKKVGAYNQKQNHGNGYNSGYPYYGEHTYSGSFIFYGYYGRFF